MGVIVAERIWFCWSPDLGSDITDARRVKARYAGDAACLWARREDCASADYWIVGGDGATVYVAEDEAGAGMLSFRVTGEQSIDYRASALGAITLATKDTP
jgi:hypothetical protein